MYLSYMAFFYENASHGARWVFLWTDVFGARFIVSEDKKASNKGELDRIFDLLRAFDLGSLDLYSDRHDV